MTEHECKYADRILNMCESVARTEQKVESLDKRINGSMEAIREHIKQGSVWRGGIVGIAITVVLQLVAFSFAYGTLYKTVAVNERIIQREIISVKRSEA